MLLKNKLNKLNDDDNKKFLEELCTWIDEHLDTPLGFNELIAKTNLTSTDLQYLFEKYKQTTPMTYIRRKREILQK
jgi:AraC-like DNA-binding protein